MKSLRGLILIAIILLGTSCKKEVDLILETTYSSAIVSACELETVVNVTLTGNGPFALSVDNTNVEIRMLSSTEFSLSGLTAGTHELIIQDASGETHYKTFEVTQQPDLELTLIKEEECLSCPETKTGVVLASVEGGAAPYTYNWSNGVTTARVENLSHGTHTVTITDASGCEITESVFVRSVTPIKTNFLDIRDNQNYSTVVIAGQRWMAENMRYITANAVMNPNNPTEKYGFLYTFEEAKNACPEGWRLATDEDWTTLEAVLGVDPTELSIYGGRGTRQALFLKGTDWNGWNCTSFGAYPSGYQSGGTFQGLAASSHFWTKDELTIEKGISRSLQLSTSLVYREAISKQDKLSCRCIEE